MTTLALKTLPPAKLEEQPVRSVFRNPIWIWQLSTLVLAILVVLVLLFSYMNLRLRILFARDQVQVFVSMRDKARTSDLQQAIDCLEYTLAYYPKGTKQVECSPLNEIVETARELAIDDMITLLRQRSSKDFGADPRQWIKNRVMFQKEE